jgi:hypothetical protein
MEGRLKKDIVIQIIIVLSIIFLLYSCYFFYFKTKGLIYVTNQGFIEYTNNLQSSGSEDNIFVFPIMLVYSILLVFTLFYGKNKKMFFYLSSLSFFIFIISLLFIQMGEITSTIFKDGNVCLIFIILLPFSIISLSYYRMKDNPSKSQ